LLSAPGLGSVVGLAFLIGLRQPRRQGQFIIGCTVAYGVALLLFAGSTSYALSFAALAMTGLLDVLVTVTRQNIMQLTTPGRMRGRVMANVRTVTGGLSQFSQTQSGFLAALLGPPLAVVIAAGVLAITGGASAWTNPVLWRFSRDEVGQVDR
jgi:hypothetical protein